MYTKPLCGCWRYNHNQNTGLALIELQSNEGQSQNNQLLQTVVSAPLGDEGATGAPRGFVEGFPQEVTSKSQAKRKFKFFIPQEERKACIKAQK